MRSRRLIGGGIAALLLLAIVGTCRQRTASFDSTQPLSGSPPTITAAEEPGLAVVDAPNRPRPATATAGQNPDGREISATITAEDPAAEVNVRLQPSADSEPIGYARVGDAVIVERSQAAEDGYTWYYVQFQQATMKGWVRSDLLDIPPTPNTSSTVTKTNSVPKAQSDALKQALDENCGDARAIEAYFVTQSHTIYICKLRGDRLYLSQEQGTQQVIKADDVEALGGGYIIGNGNFEYRLDSGNFVVVWFDETGQQEEVLREAVTYTERF